VVKFIVDDVSVVDFKVGVVDLNLLVVSNYVSAAIIV